MTGLAECHAFKVDHMFGLYRRAWSEGGSRHRIGLLHSFVNVRGIGSRFGLAVPRQLSQDPANPPFPTWQPLHSHQRRSASL